MFSSWTSCRRLYHFSGFWVENASESAKEERWDIKANLLIPYGLVGGVLQTIIGLVDPCSRFVCGKPTLSLSTPTSQLK